MAQGKADNKIIRNLENKRLQDREKHAQAVDKLKDKNDALKDKIKSKSNQIADTERKRVDDIKDIREKQRNKEKRAQILRHTKALTSKLVRPTDKSNIPKEFRGAIAEMLSSINLESKNTINPITKGRVTDGSGVLTQRTQAFIKLREVLTSIKESTIVDPALLGDGDYSGLLSEVVQMSDVKLDEMNSTQLETVWKAIRATEEALTSYDKLVSIGKYNTISKLAVEIKNDTKTRRNKRTLSEKHYMIDMETPYTFFSRFGQMKMLFLILLLLVKILH